MKTYSEGRLLLDYLLGIFGSFLCEVGLHLEVFSLSCGCIICMLRVEQIIIISILIVPPDAATDSYDVITHTCQPAFPSQLWGS